MGIQGAEIAVAVPVTNTYVYDKVGNRIAAIQTDESGYVVESRKYIYKVSIKMVSVDSLTE